MIKNKLKISLLAASISIFITSACGYQNNDNNALTGNTTNKLTNNSSIEQNVEPRDKTDNNILIKALDKTMKLLSYDDGKTKKNINKNKEAYDVEESKKLGEIIKSNIPNININSIFKINGTNFFSVYANDSGEVMHTNSKGDYFIISFFNNQPVALLTKQMEPITTIKEQNSIYKDIISNIDKSNLIRFKFGKGKNSIFIFSDPDCKFCKMLDTIIHNNLTSSDNVTIYYVMTPLLELHPDAGNKAAKILCSNNKEATWKEWQLNNKTPNVSEEKAYDCMDEMSNQSLIGSIIGVNSTPTMINGNGIVATGAIKIDQIREFITFK